MNGCGFCTQAKEFLRAEGIAYVEVPHVRRPEFKSFPVLIVDGKALFEGFDKAPWRSALKSLPERSSSQSDEISSPSGQAEPPPSPERLGASCGKRVTPKNVGTMLGVGAVSGVLGTEGTIPLIAMAGAAVYYLGAKRYGCQVRATGTGLLFGAVVAAVRHCVNEDRKDEAARRSLQSGA